MYVCGFCFPVLIVAFCYTFIIQSVSKHEKEIAKMGKSLGASDLNKANETSAEIKIAN